MAQRLSDTASNNVEKRSSNHTHLHNCDQAPSTNPCQNMIFVYALSVLSALVSTRAQRMSSLLLLSTLGPKRREGDLQTCRNSKQTCRTPTLLPSTARFLSCFVMLSNGIVMLSKRLFMGCAIVEFFLKVGILEIDLKPCPKVLHKFPI